MPSMSGNNIKTTLESTTPTNLGNLGCLPAEVRARIFETLLAETNNRTDTDVWNRTYRALPTEILRTSGDVLQESHYAFQKSANLFIRIVIRFKRVRDFLKIFGISANFNHFFANSRVQISVDFSDYTFAHMHEIEDEYEIIIRPTLTADVSSFDIFLDDLPKLLRMLRFLQLAVGVPPVPYQGEPTQLILQVHFFVTDHEQDRTSTAEKFMILNRMERIMISGILVRSDVTDENCAAYRKVEQLRTLVRPALKWEDLVREATEMAHFLLNKVFVLCMEEQYDDAERVSFVIRQFTDIIEMHPLVRGTWQSETTIREDFDRMISTTNESFRLSRMLAIRPKADIGDMNPYTINYGLEPEGLSISPMFTFLDIVLTSAMGENEWSFILCDNMLLNEEPLLRQNESLYNRYIRAREIFEDAGVPEGFTLEHEKRMWALLPYILPVPDYHPQDV